MVDVKFKMGQKVIDRISGFKGIITAIAQYYNGCVRYQVQPRMNKNEEFQDSEMIDQEQLDLIPEKKKLKVPTINHGGDRPGLPKFKL